MNDIKRRIQSLPAEKLKLINRRLKLQQRISDGYNNAIPKRASATNPPLSLSQRPLWFFDQIEPCSAVYNRCANYRLRGALNIEALQQALVALVTHHESLRTTFKMEGNEPLQVIVPERQVELPILDLSDQDIGNRKAALQRLTSEEAQRPFTLAQGPLLRTTLLKLAERDHILMVTIHHIISDGWSTGIFNRELSHLYNGINQGRPAELPELPVQYADYAQWQREWMQGKVLEGQLDYWKKQLEGAPSLLELPTDRPRPAIRTFRGNRQSIIFPNALRDALKELSGQEGATLFMILLGAFQVLLHRYTGQEDIVVGTPIANRRHSEIEGLIGLFINVLVLRSDLSGNPTFRDLIKRVREVALGAYDHQDLPFGKLVEELHPGRNLSYSPLFQIMFAYQNIPKTGLNIDGLDVTHIETNKGTAHFDLSLIMENDDQGLKATLEYNTDLFDTGTMVRMLDHYKILLEGIVADITQSVSKLPLLSEDERHQLLVEWNDTRMNFSEHQCIHDLIADQVIRTPQAVAVVYKDLEITYADLEARANQLADYLRERGVGPEVLVGICVERSLEMIVGILGILKAGGAYVPLDPFYPKERLAYILKDTKTKILLTQTKLLECLPGHCTSVVCLDIPLDISSVHDQDNHSTCSGPDNLSYVIYTSGSTGKPKGVEITHKALVNYVSAAARTFGLTRDDRVLQFAPISFDTAVEEIFTTLAYGATLVIRSDSMLDSMQIFLGRCQEQGITVLDLPTAFWHELTTALSSEKLILPDNIRIVIIGGERVSPEKIALWKECAPQKTRLINGYGPTEATVAVTMADLTEEKNSKLLCNKSIIGHPIQNTQVYVLDPYLNPVPIGVLGELHIGGMGLARGYLNKPELTVERFIANPFNDDPHARLYKTGDLVRWLPDGNIEYLGRTDHQVKIRGFRIELGEIEVVLEQHSEIKDVVVMAREDTPGDKRLVAYLVYQSGSQIIPNDLSKYLHHNLPDYMIPTRYVDLEVLPLTPNGKVDHKALPVPEVTPRELDECYVVPTTPQEELMALLWAKILGLSKVGATDNFFEMGGHSLMATRLMTHIRDSFEVDIPLRRLFEKPTVKALTEAIEQDYQGKEEQETEINPLHPFPRPAKLPLSYAQSRLWFLDQLETDSSFYNIFSGYRLQGLLNIQALQQALDTLVARHESLRTIFRVEGDGPVQVIVPEQMTNLPVVNLMGQEASNRQLALQCLAKEEAQRPFDLAQGPLLRTTLVRLEEHEHVLIVVMHHIISDGWSMDIFDRELDELYDAYCQGRPAELPELPVQYADYSQWQRKWLQGDVLERQLGYWKKQLEGAPPLLEFPTDRPRPAIQTFCGDRQSIVLPRVLSDALKELSRQEGVTLFMTLLAAFQVLLHRYSGQKDIVVGTPIANRTRPEVEGLIGFFVNTLAMRTSLFENLTFRDLVKRVRNVALGAYAHQDLPFNKLVEELHPERNSKHSPLFQVVFTLENNYSESIEQSSLSKISLETDKKTAKFDMTLCMLEHNGGLEALLEFNTDLFDATTISRMLGHYQVLLEGFTSDPNQSIDSLPMLSGAEHHQILVEWNETRTDYPKDKCIHQLFELQVERSPNNIAVAYESQFLTYRELNARANQLAHSLRAHGVVSGTLVGICMERSLEMVVGLLGILKAGGAYVPLDPDYPKERLVFMLDETLAPVLITQKALKGQLPKRDAHVICLDADWDNMSKYNQSNLINYSAPEDLAYVIYTSGSTGKPKGVPVPHRAVNRLVLNTNYITLGDRDKIAQVSNISFDAATFEIWGALLNGAQLVGIEREVTLSPRDLAKYIDEHQITVIFLTTALFNLIARMEPAALHSMRCVLFGGEEVDQKWVRVVIEKGPPEFLLHVYGPTENTTFTSWYLINEASKNARTIPIGRPISNTQIYLLDKHMNPVPVGVCGELYTGGYGLARGYLNSPEMTAENFISNPFSDDPDQHLYSTGDLARYLPDGNLEFIGRVDYQVKNRGFRIELGEIESVLSKHPLVLDVVVLLREDGENDIQGDKRLVAYVVTSRQGNVSATVLQGYLKERLPEYMVPATYIFLVQFPLTPNGKLDTRALPEPTIENTVFSTIRREPRDSLELRLARIWENVLNTRAIGIDDNFFDLGGHSLLGVHLLEGIEKLFGKRLPVSTLFSAPTIAAMAHLLRDKEESKPSLISDNEKISRWNSLVPIQPHGTCPPFFCVHGRAHSLAKYMDINQPLYWLHHGQDASRTTYQTVEDIAVDHLNEIKYIQPNGPYFLGGFSFGGMIAYEIALQLSRQGDKVALLALFDPSPPRVDTSIDQLVGQALNRFKQASPKNIQLKNYMFKVKNGLNLRSRRLFYRIRDKSRYLLCKYYILRMQSIPAVHTAFHLKEIFKKASDKYVYHNYTGKIIVFVPESYKNRKRLIISLRQRWNSFTNEDIEFLFVKGAVTHHNIVDEPYVQNLVSQLNSRLKKIYDQTPTTDNR